MSQQRTIVYATTRCDVTMMYVLLTDVDEESLRFDELPGAATGAGGWRLFAAAGANHRTAAVVKQLHRLRLVALAHAVP